MIFTSKHIFNINESLSTNSNLISRNSDRPIDYDNDIELKNLPSDNLKISKDELSIKKIDDKINKSFDKNFRFSVDNDEIDNFRFPSINSDHKIEFECDRFSRHDKLKLSNRFNKQNNFSSSNFGSENDPSHINQLIDDLIARDYAKKKNLELKNDHSEYISEVDSDDKQIKKNVKSLQFCIRIAKKLRKLYSKEWMHIDGKTLIEAQTNLKMLKSLINKFEELIYNEFNRFPQKAELLAIDDIINNYNKLNVIVKKTKDEIKIIDETLAKILPEKQKLSRLLSDYSKWFKRKFQRKIKTSSDIQKVYDYYQRYKYLKTLDLALRAKKEKLKTFIVAPD